MLTNQKRFDVSVWTLSAGEKQKQAAENGAAEATAATVDRDVVSSISASVSWPALTQRVTQLANWAARWVELLRLQV